MCVRMPPTGQRTATSTWRLGGGGKRARCVSSRVASCVDIVRVLRGEGDIAQDQFIQGTHAALGGEAGGAGPAALGHRPCRLWIINNPANGGAQAGGVLVIDHQTVLA